VATLRLRIVFVQPHEHPDAPDAVALLRVRHERPCSRRAAERSDEFAPSKANAHLALPCEPVDQPDTRASTGEDLLVAAKGEGGGRQKSMPVGSRRALAPKFVSES
jgi:hypothetical protein